MVVDLVLLLAIHLLYQLSHNDFKNDMVGIILKNILGYSNMSCYVLFSFFTMILFHCFRLCDIYVIKAQIPYDATRTALTLSNESQSFLTTFQEFILNYFFRRGYFGFSRFLISLVEIIPISYYIQGI